MWVQSAHRAGPALIMQLLWPSVRLHPRPWFGFQEPFVKWRSGKGGWFAAVLQTWRTCLREPQFARQSRSPPPRWSSEGGGVISRRQRWRKSLDLQCICNAQTSLACRLISGKETGPKPTDWWGFVSNYSTYCSASPKNWKMRSSPQP